MMAIAVMIIAFLFMIILIRNPPVSVSSIGLAGFVLLSYLHPLGNGASVLFFQLSVGSAIIFA
jgi:hypothetical protein